MKLAISEITSGWAAQDFMRAAEDFLHDRATIRDICEARKEFVAELIFEFGLSDAEATAAVRRVEILCGLLRG